MRSPSETTSSTCEDDELASSEVAAFVGELDLEKKSTEMEHVRAGQVLLQVDPYPNPCHFLVGDSKMLEVPIRC